MDFGPGNDPPRGPEQWEQDAFAYHVSQHWLREQGEDADDDNDVLGLGSSGGDAPALSGGQMVVVVVLAVLVGAALVCAFSAVVR